jgi:hypothetical protein
MGEIVNIRGTYTGRFWQFNEDEADALLYLPHIDQVLYLMGLRRHMDFATGTVGIRRKVSYQMFKELLEVHRQRGSTKPDHYPKRDELRASIKRLEGAGLVQKLPSTGKAIAESMVFKLPLAQIGRSIPVMEEQPERVTAAHTPQDSVVAGAGEAMTPTLEKVMNPTPRNINISVLKEHTENSSELSRSESPDSDCSEALEAKAVDQGVGDLKACPHQAILQIWKDVLPGKTQPNVNLWSKQKASAHLRSMWREAATIPHSSGTRTLYSTREEGLRWWRAFFTDLSKSNFLMSSEAAFFDLGWVVKRDNFLKSLDGKYRNKGNGHA